MTTTDMRLVTQTVKCANGWLYQPVCGQTKQRLSVMLTNRTDSVSVMQKTAEAISPMYKWSANQQPVLQAKSATNKLTAQ